MPRARRDVPPAEVSRLAKVRSSAARAVEEADAAKEAALLADMPDAATDVLGAIAWAATVLGQHHPTVAELVEGALARRLEWREIAVAFGVDPSDDGAVANVAQSHRRRRGRG